MTESKPEPQKTVRVHAPTIRSQLVLQVSAGLTGGDDPLLRQARVFLRGHGADGWPVCLDSLSTPDAIEAVVARRSTLAMMNPAAILTLAHRGNGPFKVPLPVRTLCTIPSRDIFTFAATADTGLRFFEDIAERRYPLKISMRAQPGHCLHMVFDHVAAAAGFNRDDLKSWGGEIRYDSRPRIPKSEALARGANAVFDEAIQSWLAKAIDDGMTILSIAEPTMKKLEAFGYRRAVISKERFPKLPNDVVSIDFSGWAVFVHADLPNKLVRQICAALDERKHLIPWDGSGDLPVERMCLDAPDTPLSVPLHPAAAQFWKERGYLS